MYRPLQPFCCQIQRSSTLFIKLVVAFPRAFVIKYLGRSLLLKISRFTEPSTNQYKLERSLTLMTSAKRTLSAYCFFPCIVPVGDRSTRTRNSLVCQNTLFCSLHFNRFLPAQKRTAPKPGPLFGKGPFSTSCGRLFPPGRDANKEIVLAQSLRCVCVLGCVEICLQVTHFIHVIKSYPSTLSPYF